MAATPEERNELQRLETLVCKGTRVISLAGLTSTAAKAWVLARLQAATRIPLVIVTDSNSDLDTFECDLEFWCGHVDGFPEPDQKSNGDDPGSEIRDPRSFACLRVEDQ